MVVLVGGPVSPITNRSLPSTVVWWRSCLKFTYSFLVAYFLSNVVSVLSASHLVCRQCGHEATLASDLIHVPSSLAHRQRNDTIQGRDKTIIQLFRNPEGKYFEVITLSKAEVLKVDKPHKAETWFPGFSWSVTVCPSCGIHLGWFFESDETDSHTGRRKSFYGLILNNLLHQEYADSLIMAPKSYTS